VCPVKYELGFYIPNDGVLRLTCSFVNTEPMKVSRSVPDDSELSIGH
jgi:hypothetical protein